jgi:hypothetical protein
MRIVAWIPLFLFATICSDPTLATEVKQDNNSEKTLVVPTDPSIPIGLIPLEPLTKKQVEVPSVPPKPLPSSLALKNSSPRNFLHSLASETILLRGASSNDRGDGAPGGMLYFAGSPVGFLAQVFVHALLQSSANDSRQKAAQVEADRVVQPFLPLIESWNKSDLLAQAQKLSGISKSLNADSLPTPSKEANHLEFGFTVSQDQQSWSVDLILSPKDPKSKSADKVFSVRAIAPTSTSEETVELLLANDGSLLRSKVTELLAEALMLLPSEQVYSKLEPAPERTLRFQDGQKTRIERGSLIAEDCERLIFKSLRNVIVSAPKPTNSVAVDCKP